MQQKEYNIVVLYLLIVPAAVSFLLISKVGRNDVS